MTFIAINAAEVTVKMDIPGNAGPAYTVFGVDGSTALSAATVLSTIQPILETATNLRNMTGNQVQFTETTVRFRSSPTVVEIASQEWSLPGILVGPHPPPQVAALFQKQTGLAGRNNRGRMYMPAPSEAEIDDAGNWSAAAITNLQGGANNFLTALAGASIPMVVLQGDPAITPPQVLGLNLSPKVATQRRRVR